MTVLAVRLSAPPGTTACTGQAGLFDSLDIGDHILAREVCRTCPVIGWCGDEFAAVYLDTRRFGSHAGPSGTWAGVLYGKTSKPIRIPAVWPPVRRRRTRSTGVSEWAGKPCLGCGRTLAIKDRTADTLPERPEGVVWHHAHGLCLTCMSRLRRNRAAS